MNINGIHMHTGSDILDVDVFLCFRNTFEAAKHFNDLEFIDFGSGFKVPYRPGDVETNVEEFGEKAFQTLQYVLRNYGKQLTLAFEPGKFLVKRGLENSL